MDRNRNRKRKANDAASPKAEGSASKRQKTRLVSAHASCCLSEEWLLVGRVDGLAAAELLHFAQKHRHGHAARPLPPTAATFENANKRLDSTRHIKTDKLRTKEHETPQTTTAIGLQFIDHLKSAKDKT
jgi:hypothetical protein